MSTELDYNRDARIDEQALDVEWLEQGELSKKYAEHYLLCKKRVNTLEEKIKVVRSELTAEVVQKPSLMKTDKATVQIIEAYFRTHKRHLKLKKRWIEAIFEMEMAEVAKNEIGFTRKAALENLVKLHGQNYFAGPSIAGDLTQKRRDREKTRAASNEKIARYRKNK